MKSVGQKPHKYQMVAILLFVIIAHLALFLAMTMIQLKQYSQHVPTIVMQDVPLQAAKTQVQSANTPEWVAVVTARNFNKQQQTQQTKSDADQEEDSSFTKQGDDNSRLDQESTSETKSEKTALHEVTATTTEQDTTILQGSIQATKPTHREKTGPITLAQLAHGFLNYTTSSESEISVKSSRNGRVSTEQLCHMHYLQKILNCIVTAYKVYKSMQPISCNTMHMTYIKLSLNKDGSINTLAVVQSSGNAAVDQFLLSLFQYASSSFPPPPPFLQQDPYLLPLFTTDRVEAFQSADNWSIITH